MGSAKAVDPAGKHTLTRNRVGTSTHTDPLVGNNLFYLFISLRARSRSPDTLSSLASPFAFAPTLAFPTTLS